MIRHLRPEYRDRFVVEALRDSPYPAVRKVVAGEPWGTVEVLGGFSKIPPTGLAGVILRVTAQHGQQYLIALVADEAKQSWKRMRIDDVPWENWDGELATAPVYRGDRPNVYAVYKTYARRLRDEATRDALADRSE